MKSLEKDRSGRYETATALSRDLQRHLTNDFFIDDLHGKPGLSSRVTAEIDTASKTRTTI